jgi:hypothetical protein
MASAIDPAVVASSRGRGGQRESAGVVRAQAQPSYGPADCRCGGEGAARPFPLLTEILAGERSGDEARSPPGRAQATAPLAGQTDLPDAGLSPAHLDGANAVP